jgi:uncharacterized protein YcfJ
MNKRVVLSITVVASVIAGPALADPRHAPGRFEGPEYADVVSADPIYRTVRIEEPRRECWDERVVYEERERDGYWFDDGVAGSVVGAIAGGVAGHQFGKGRGKDAATVLGAVIGAGVGQRVAVRNRNPAPGAYERVGYEERCQTITEHRTEQRIESYDVAYRYGGRTYHTTLPYDPGERIAVDVSVRPSVHTSRPVSY